MPGCLGGKQMDGAAAPGVHPRYVPERGQVLRGVLGELFRLLPLRQDPASAAVSGERHWSSFRPIDRRPEKGAACNGQLVPEDCEWRAWN